MGAACRSYIRSGKRLPKRVSEIAIQFNEAPHAVFGGNGAARSRAAEPSDPAHPAGGRHFAEVLLSKRPGAGMTLRPVSMDFNYGSSFGERSPSAYETLLLDAMVGDATLYTRQDMVEASWAVVQPIQEVWQNRSSTFPTTRREAGGRWRAMRCWRGTAMSGGDRRWCARQPEILKELVEAVGGPRP